LILSPKTNYNLGLGNHLGKWQHWYWLTTILRNRKYTTHSEETVRREWVRPDAGHARCSNAPAPADGAAGSGIG